MSWKLRILSGPKKDKEIQLFSGLKIGREQGDLILADPKASALHASIAHDPQKDVWTLLDLQSKNGLRANGKRISSLTLSPGIRFVIGDSLLEVIADTMPEDELAATETAIAAPFVAEIAPSAPAPPDFSPPPVPPKSRTWSEILSEFAVDEQAKVKNLRHPIAAFNPALRLSFIRGVQVETVWTLGYGPRRVGSTSVDLPLYEEQAPDLCFELIPTPHGTLFKTAHPDQVLLNGSSQKAETLKPGDIIEVLNTAIEVDFIKWI